jgi:HSP20 family protein
LATLDRYSKVRGHLADLSETDDAYVIKVDLPGVDKKHVNVELNDQELIVNGEILEQEEHGRRLRKRAAHRALRVPCHAAQ